ncbi:carbohydrate-binding protein [Micromonospora sp. R77]|nr:carbohydrate-binding protein [Micromonospora sp. R77]MCI4061421.1 carbohydrate-binding protein [Micromonospora sp. R77]
MTSASAAACAVPWQPSAVYTGGNQVSANGHNYQAKWWTRNEAPPGTTGVWNDLGTCGGSTPPTSTTPPATRATSWSPRPSSTRCSRAGTPSTPTPVWWPR